MLMASTSLVPQHTLGGHYTPEGSSTPRETEVTDHPLGPQGWEVAQRSLGDQGCLSLSQDSLQAQHVVVGSGESPPEYKELPPQSQTQRQVKGYLPTSSS